MHRGCWTLSERPGGRGRRLLVYVRWAGEQPVTRLPWDDEWIDINMMTADMKRAAREMERAKYAKREQHMESAEGGTRRRSPRLADGGSG